MPFLALRPPSPAMTLTVRPFTAADYAPYRRWYDDPVLDARLGPIDDDWLDCVLREVDGRQAVCEEAGTMVAVAGVVLPRDTGGWGAVSDLAVDPARRGMGIGRRVLRALLARPELASVTEWRAWAEHDNLGAIGVLRAAGWRHVGIDDGMVEFRLVRAGALAS